MRCFICVALVYAIAAPVQAQRDTARSWSDLSQEVRPGWTIKMVLPDATLVEGRAATFTPEALTMRVVKTSNSVQHPKGQITVPREQVKAVEIRNNGTKGRWIGVLVPVAAGVVAGAAEGSKGDFLSAQAGAALFLIVAVAGGTAGYFIGRSVDRQFHTLNLKP